MKIYAVGGQVRDELLGLVPKDRDWLIVGATDQDVENLTQQGFTQVGADFPVFLHPKTNEEYALARVERKTGNGYHGFTVQADSSVSAEEDLSRRDLTINSIAKDESGNLVDPFNGLKDIRNRVLRHTSPAFSEDPLRVLRIARFAARMPTWQIAPETLVLCNKVSMSGELNSLSIERIWAEMQKGFNETDARRFVKVLSDTGALKHCHLLKDIFGDLSNQQIEILGAIKKVNADKLTISIATLAKADSKLNGAPTRIVDCFKNIHNLGTTHGSAEDIFKVLKAARVQSEGPQFEDFIAAVQVCERAGINFAFSCKELLIGTSVVRSIKASQFSETGKSLGDAIKNKQIESLKLALNLK